MKPKMPAKPMPMKPSNPMRAKTPHMPAHGSNGMAGKKC
jgi:hypothetical protein